MPMRVDEYGLPRISLLDDSVNRANYCNPLALSVSFWPVSKGYNFSTRHKQRSEKETTWAGRAAAKTKAKGLWTRQRSKCQRGYRSPNCQRGEEGRRPLGANEGHRQG